MFTQIRLYFGRRDQTMRATRTKNYYNYRMTFLFFVID